MHRDFLGKIKDKYIETFQERYKTNSQRLSGKIQDKYIETFRKNKGQIHRDFSGKMQDKFIEIFRKDVGQMHRDLRTSHILYTIFSLSCFITLFMGAIRGTIKMFIKYKEHCAQIGNYDNSAIIYPQIFENCFINALEILNQMIFSILRFHTIIA